MKKAKVPTKQSFTDAVMGVWYVIRRVRYAAVAVFASFVISYIIYFSINSNLYGSLLGSSLPFVDKLSVLGVITTTMVGSYWTELNGALLLVVSLLQGVTLAVLIFTMRRNRKMDMAMAGRSGFAMIAALLGLGCVPCGTSLIIPVMTLVFSSSAAALVSIASVVVLVVALLLTLYSLYKIGLVAHKFYLAGEEV